MKIVILGAGGVGGYFGGRLAAAGADVTFVARGAHLAGLQRDGLKILSQKGDLHLNPIKVVDSVAKIDSADLVIVGVKLWDTDSAAISLRPLVEKGAAVLSLQNGVHKDEILKRHLPSASVMGGVCFIAAAIAEPGVIRHTGMMQRLVFGEFDGSASARTTALLDACKQAGIDAEISPTINRVIWEKFVFIVGMSGTTATMRQSIGFIRENPEARSFLRDVMLETIAVGRAKGVDLSPDYADNRVAFYDTLPPTMSTSMHHDLEKGNRLELPWLSGGVAELGRELGVPTPLNRAISAVLSPYALGRRA